MISVPINYLEVAALPVASLMGTASGKGNILADRYRNTSTAEKGATTPAPYKPAAMTVPQRPAGKNKDKSKGMAADKSKDKAAGNKARTAARR